VFDELVFILSEIKANDPAGSCKVIACKYGGVKRQREELR